MIPSSNQSIASMLSGSVKTYRRNLVKLFLIFILSFALLALPVIVNLDAIVTQLHEAVVSLDGTVTAYTLIYIFEPMIRNGLLVWAFAFMLIIAAFTTPLFMGITGKIISEDAMGKPCTVSEALRWTLGQYKRLLTSYALYYAVFTAFAGSFALLLYWIVKKASHLISDVWLNPMIAMFVVGGALLLLGTIYLPFVAMDERKGSFRAYAGSFKDMYSKYFVRHFPALLVAGVIAAGVSFGVLFPVAPPLFLGHQGNAMQFLTDYNNVLATILAAVAAFSFVGVFLYIFAYNTYRNTGAASFPRERKTVNTTYRRKINIVEPSYRRRIG